MEEYKIPNDYELDGLAEDFVCSTDDCYLPIREENLDYDSLAEFAHDRGFELREDQMSDLVGYILYSSNSACERILEEAKQDFRDSLEEAISSASNRLSNEDMLKIIISVTNYNFGD